MFQTSICRTVPRTDPILCWSYKDEMEERLDLRAETLENMLDALLVVPLQKLDENTNLKKAMIDVRVTTIGMVRSILGLVTYQDATESERRGNMLHRKKRKRKN
ncbi:DNAJ heat shock N-terminal domain-containing protein [Striga asiatica]|uniref:DNAJ heat shock N-terminal domain-containing protein n=1 Tax=Striga asiatica TaxID=4170 RepID=A0A5A7QEK6_STRAF|nr:DNAJ heat shock N-terminal domain-containing protein [Striga asiatica]